MSPKKRRGVGLRQQVASSGHGAHDAEQTQQPDTMGASKAGTSAGAGTSGSTFGARGSTAATAAAAPGRPRRTAQRGAAPADAVFPLLLLPPGLLTELVVPHLGPWARAQLRGTCKELRGILDESLPSMLHGCLLVDGHLAGPMRTTRAQSARHASALPAAEGPCGTGFRRTPGSSRTAVSSYFDELDALEHAAHQEIAKTGTCLTAATLLAPALPILQLSPAPSGDLGHSLGALCGLLARGVGRVKGLQLILERQDTWQVPEAKRRELGRSRGGAQCAWVADALQQLGHASAHSLTSFTLTMGQGLPLSPAILAALCAAWPQLRTLQLVAYEAIGSSRKGRSGDSWEAALRTLPSSLESVELHITGPQDSSIVLRALPAAAHLAHSLRTVSILEATDFGHRMDAKLLLPLLTPQLGPSAAHSAAAAIATDGGAAAAAGAGGGVTPAAAAGGAAAAAAAAVAAGRGGAAAGDGAGPHQSGSGAGPSSHFPIAVAHPSATAGAAAAGAGPAYGSQQLQLPLSCLDLACHDGDVTQLLLACPNVTRIALLRLPEGKSLVDLIEMLPCLTSLRLTDTHAEDFQFDSLTAPATVQALNCLKQLSLSIEALLNLTQALGEPGAAAQLQPPQPLQPLLQGVAAAGLPQPPAVPGVDGSFTGSAAAHPDAGADATTSQQSLRPLWHGCLSHLELLELYSDYGDLFIEQLADVLPMLAPTCQLVLRYNALDVEFDTQITEDEGRAVKSKRAVAALKTISRHPGGLHMWTPCNIDVQCVLPADPDAQAELMHRTCCVGAMLCNMVMDGTPEERAAAQTFFDSLEGIDLQPDLFEIIAALSDMEAEQPHARPLDPSKSGHPVGAVAGKAHWVRALVSGPKKLLLQSMDLDAMATLMGILSRGWFQGVEQIIVRLSDDEDVVGEGMGAVLLGMYLSAQDAPREHAEGQGRGQGQGQGQRQQRQAGIRVLLRPHQPHHALALRHLVQFVRARIKHPDDFQIMH